MAEWFVAIDGQQQGPFPEERVIQDLKAGRLDASTLVFTAGMTEWQPLRDVPRLSAHVARPAAASRPASAAAPAGPAHAATAQPAPARARTAGAADDVPSHSLAEFVAATSERDNPGDVFELEGSHMLEAHVRGRLWSKLGAMVAYRGELKFVREGAFEGGLEKFLKKAVSGEASALVKIEGNGVVYLADQKKNITILRLQAGDVINVNGNDLLAFEETISYDITMHRRVAGMMAGGLFSVRLHGTGMVAIMSHGAPLTLRCTPSDPIVTDPNATVAWSGNLSPEIKTDISFRSLIGRGGGEAFQMLFRGDGFVVVQPFEEKPAVAGQG
jgi:uncharacterized protein (AIM24 family)